MVGLGLPEVMGQGTHGRTEGASGLPPHQCSFRGTLGLDPWLLEEDTGADGGRVERQKLHVKAYKWALQMENRQSEMVNPVGRSSGLPRSATPRGSHLREPSASRRKRQTPNVELSGRKLGRPASRTLLPVIPPFIQLNLILEFDRLFTGAPSNYPLHPGRK